jgi:hypothetical protein
MSTRNHVLALIFLMAVLAFTVFAAKRLLFRISPAASGVALPPHAANPATKPSVPKPSSAVPAPSSTSPASTKVAPASPAAVAPTPAVPASPAPAPPAPARSATAPAAPARATPPPASPAHSVPAPSARARATPAPAPKTRENASTPAAKGAVPAPPKAQPPAAKHPAVVAKDRHSEDRHLEDRHSESHHSENQHAEADRAQLRFGSGVRLWIRVIAINRKPDGSFTFRGALLQPVTLANRNQLDPGTGVAGSGTADNGHLQVQVSGFTIAGANYELLDASGSNGRSGTGLAVELDPGKLLEVWLAPSSMYRKTP